MEAMVVGREDIVRVQIPGQVAAQNMLYYFTKHA